MSDKWKMENPWKEKWFVFLRKETDQRIFYCKRFVLTSVTTSPTFTNHRQFLIFSCSILIYMQPLLSTTIEQQPTA